MSISSQKTTSSWQQDGPKRHESVQLWRFQFVGRSLTAPCHLEQSLRVKRKLLQPRAAEHGQALWPMATADLNTCQLFRRAQKNATDRAGSLRLAASAGPPTTRPLARGAEKQMALLAAETQPVTLQTQSSG